MNEAVVAPSVDTEKLGFLAGGGEMGARIRAFPWEQTPLGPAARWPQSLKTIVRVMLDSKYAMWMLWGPELTFLCNDAYLPTVGIKRDWVLGERSDKVWEEIWPDIGPRIDHVLQGGEATWDEGLLLYLERSGFPEETYHTFSYSPVLGDDDQIAGMLCVVTEVTERVIGERRLSLLRDLGATRKGSLTVEETGLRSCAVIDLYPLDVAFVGLYLFDETLQQLKLRAHTQNAVHLPSIWKSSEFGSAWSIDGIHLEFAGDLADLSDYGIHTQVPTFSEAVLHARIVALQGSLQGPPAGLLILGASPRRPYDATYRDFLSLAAAQISAAVADAQAYESERKRAAALAELDRAKTAFFSNVSHEFRTPLTLMIGPLEDLLTQHSPESQSGKQVELAHRNSMRLLKLVNSLLDFSRIEAGRAQAHFEPVALGPLTRDLASSFRSAIERAGLSFDVQCDELHDPVYVDRDMWEKIVLNLLSNAFKFTLTGTIAVRLSGDDSGVRLRIEDTGVGVPTEELPRLFERFHRVESTRGRTHEGTGIGLALVQELVRLHGGSISAESTLGRGTEFNVVIPWGSAHLPATQLRASSSDAGPSPGMMAYVAEAARWQTGSESKATLTPTLELSRTDRRFESTFGAHVLIADDNADMRAYLRELLSPCYRFRSEVDGADALAAAREARPDLIISDVMMPRLDGFGFLKALRADEDLRDVPVILLSARAGEESRIEGLDAGADDYLVKPFAARELLARIGALLELTKMRAENEERLRLALSSIRDQFFMLDEFDRYTLVNSRVTEVTGRSKRELLGENLFHVFPEMRGTAFAPTLADARRSQKPCRCEFFYEPFGRWLESTVYPAGSSLAVLITDTTEQVLARDALLEQQRRLELADRQKDQFLAMLAHELRNPLAPIRNASELLARVAPQESQFKTMAEMIQRQSSQLTRLVDDLLDVSRINSGRIHLTLDTVDLAQVVQQAFETIDPLIREKAQHLTLSPSRRPLKVHGDFARLLQCVVNLLNNAIKYTDRGGSIDVEVGEQEGFARIDVSDTGVGIPAELLQNIFDLFVQADQTLDRSQGGLGIGLSVVRGLVEMHHGHVTAYSAGVNKGSTFTMRLPLVADIATSDASETSSASKPLSILIVDDNNDAADSFAQLLSLDGHLTHAVYSGREALDWLATSVPDVAVLDIGLPGMNGYELARQIRQQPQLSGIRLIALTGYSQKEDRELAIQAGFDVHLVKPVNYQLLLETLATT